MGAGALVGSVPMGIVRAILVPSVCGVLAAGCASGGGGATAPVVQIPSGTSSPVSGGSKPGDWETSEYNAQHGLDGINAAEAYAALTAAGKPAGGEGVRIAIIDSGIDAGHADLAGAVTYRAIIDPRDPQTDSHGTHIGALAAGRRNGSGVHGVAFDADLVDIKVSFGGGATGTDIFYEVQAVAAGIASAAGLDTQFAGSRIFSANPAAEADIINISIGGGTAETTKSVHAAMRLAAAENKIMVIAAGNAGAAEPDYPALHALDEAIRGLGIVVVGGELQADGSWAISADSNRCGSAYEFCLMAPGTDIYSARTGDGFLRMTGTSMAAPHVSGALAVVMAAFPGVTEEDLVARILMSGSNAGDGPNVVDGWGMLDLFKAVSPNGALTIPEGDAVSGPGFVLAGPPVLPSAFSGALSPDTRSVLALDETGFPFQLPLARNDTGDFDRLAELTSPAPAAQKLTMLHTEEYVLHAASFSGGAYSSAGGGETFRPLGWADAGDGLALSLAKDLGNGWSLVSTQSFSAQRVRGGDIFDLVPGEQATMALVETGLQRGLPGGGAFRGRAGIVRENGQFLGEALSPFGTVQVEGTSHYLDFQYTAPLQSGTRMSAWGTLADARLDNMPFLTSGQAVLDGYGLQLETAPKFAGGGQFELSLSKPLSPLAGSGRWHLPVARTRDGDIQYLDDSANWRRSLPVEMEGRYAISPVAGLDLYFNSAVRMDDETNVARAAIGGVLKF